MGLFGIVVLCTISFFTAISRPRTSPVRSMDASRLTWKAMSILLLPFLACYFVLVVPLALMGAFFDRYLLELIAILLIYALRWHQERMSQTLPGIATGTLVVFAILGVAATHDLFAMARAEVRLTDSLQRAGVPRTEIRGGFDFDSTTQVETTGYLNDPHIVNPPNSYHPYLGKDQEPPCGYAYLRYVPSLRIKYVIAAAATPCLDPSTFPKQSYRTWLPPARREIFIGVPSKDSVLYHP